MSRLMSKSKAAQTMKESLLQWLCIRHATNKPLTREMLKKAALEFVEYYNVEGYKCGGSWLTQFLKRYKFSPSLTECCGPEFDNFIEWIEIMRPYLSNYQYEDQFFLDELVMYTDFKPCDQYQNPARDMNDTGSSVDFNEENLNTKALRPPAMNIVTILLAVNASGTEKMPPIISGRYKIETPSQDCVYQCDNYSRINDGMLAGWLMTMNTKMAEINRKIILVLNRSHINAVNFAQLTHIQPVYLPNKFPSNLRPLRRDVSHFIKMHYRSNYVQGLCQEPTKDFWEPEEIINCLVEAWKKIPPELIVVNFQRTKFRNDDWYLNMQCPQWHTLKIGVSFEKFVTFDDCLNEARDGNYNGGLVERINVDNELRKSFSQDGSLISKSNFIEDSMSSEDLDGSLKRPSDDSVDGNSCEPMDFSNANRSFPVKVEDIHENIQPLAKEDDYAEETQQSIDWKSVGSDKPVINLASDRSAGSDQRDEDNSVENTSRSSPIDIFNSNIDKRSTNVTNECNEYKNSYSSCPNYQDKFFYPYNQSNSYTNLDQKYDRYGYDSERLGQMVYPSSPVPSTSKQGLEESYALQRLYSGGEDFNGKIHQLTPIVIKSPRVDIFMDRDNDGAGDGNDNSKRLRSNEDCIHNPATVSENCACINEPSEKKMKYEAHWSDCYQHQPVFGHNHCYDSYDYPVNLQTGAMEPTDATDNIEVEKRSIFTVTDSQGQFGVKK
ncbi:uncharacterized protein LOC123272488 [Cotesia glomerata]|uniref:HTH CENPB-type domain-containing protein n=1 Tax=Cotesia glomerata TaxID=32391 RepID=A0AAV7INP5_COTGL|nr:uncharacterized protein LOC123272488 [Cotesia glomerata]KAH0564586.1 hypothetical protein KQX54_012930 [Cotesia glomerata]